MRIGPAFTMAEKDDGNHTGNPSISFDGEIAYLSGWHIHTPGEHSIDGVNSRAEMHFVYTNGQHEYKAVVGFLLDAGIENSTFVGQFPHPLTRFNDTTTRTRATINLSFAFDEANNFRNFWTYVGSLTVPPCKEGIRWFVSRDAIYTSVEQMQAILAASTYSTRGVQMAWQHQINT